jgi:hypothetical protein
MHRTNSPIGELRTPSGIGLAQLHHASIPGEKCFSTQLRLPACATPPIKNVDFLLQVLDLILFNLIYPLCEGSSFPIKNHSVRLPRLINQKSFCLEAHREGELSPCSAGPIEIRISHFNSQREHLLLGTIIEAGSGSQSENRTNVFPVACAARTDGKREGELLPCSIEPLFRIRNPKTAFRNHHCAHETLDFLKNFEIFYFRFHSKNSPLSRIVGFEISLFNSVHSPVAVCKDPSVLSTSHTSIRNANVSCWAPDSRRTWEVTSLATNYVTYGHIKSLNVNDIFCTTSSHQRRNASNSKNCQNKKSLNVTDAPRRCPCFLLQPKVQASQSKFKNRKSKMFTEALIIGVYHVLSAFDYCPTIPRPALVCT